jgi:hypothetical protein
MPCRACELALPLPVAFWLLSIGLLLAVPRGGTAQGTITGTVYAAPGEDIRGTWVIACHAVSNRCDDKSRQTRGYQIGSGGASARYALRDLAAGQYMLVAFKDRNGNGAEDRDDWSGHFPAPDGTALIITPPMRDVDVRLRLGGVVPATPAPAPEQAPSPTTAATATPRGAPAPTNPPPDRAMGGIFVGIRQNWNLSMGVPIKSANEHLFALLPDGRALYAAPHHGLHVRFDWSTCADGAICGVYEVRGNEVHVGYNNGYHQIFLRDGKRLTQVRAYWDGYEQGGLNERRYYMQVDLHDGLKLDGRWAVVDERDGRELVSIALTSDGKFAERGLIQPTNLILPRGEREARERLRMTGGSGTYSITANTLELRYANGPVLHFLFTITPEVRWSPKPERIQINRIELANVQ